MKIPKVHKRSPLAVLFVAFAVAAQGQVFLQDDFTGSVIDPLRWQAAAPFADSSATVNNGFAVLRNRGRLLSVTNMPASLEVTGRFAFTGNPHDTLIIMTRCDGQATAPLGYFDRGIGFGLRIASDGGQTSGNLFIMRCRSAADVVVVQVGTHPMTSNVFYNFRITDNGTNVALYVDDLSRPVVEASVTNQFGHQLGVYNREGAAAGTPIAAGSVSEIDHLTVTPITRLPPRAAIRVERVEVCWDSEPTKNYQLQFKSALTANIWTDLGSPVQAAGTNTCILDVVPRTEPQKIYRVLTLE